MLKHCGALLSECLEIMAAPPAIRLRLGVSYFPLYIAFHLAWEDSCMGVTGRMLAIAFSKPTRIAQLKNHILKLAEVW